MKILFKNKGFLVIEVLIASSIIAAAALATMAAAQKSTYAARNAFHAIQAGFLLEEGAEAVRILRDNTWGNISNLTPATNYYASFTGSTWILSPTPNTVGIFTRIITISNVNRDNVTQDISSLGTDDIGTRLVTVTTSWSEGTTVVSKNMQFYIMDIFSE